MRWKTFPCSVQLTPPARQKSTPIKPRWARRSARWSRRGGRLAHEPVLSIIVRAFFFFFFGCLPSIGQSSGTSSDLATPPPLGRRSVSCWCWKEGCTSCQSLTSALYGLSNTLSSASAHHNRNTSSARLAESLHDLELTVRRLKSIVKQHDATYDAFRLAMQKGEKADAAGRAARSDLQQQQLLNLRQRCERASALTLAEMEDTFTRRAPPTSRSSSQSLCATRIPAPPKGTAFHCFCSSNPRCRWHACGRASRPSWTTSESDAPS